jgi:GntR family transcriptional regulator
MSGRLKKGPIPLYYQLERVLRKRILNGRLPPENQFPTERQLCEEFEVSRITVRQTLMILENEGLIRREQGRGTFANPPANAAGIPFELYGYLDDVFYIGAQTRLEIRSKKLISPDAEIARDMSVESGDRIYLLEGVRHFGNKHKAFFQAFVPKSIGEKISIKKISSPFLISIVERVSLEMVKKAHITISAAVATRKLAAIMGLKTGHPLLVIKRVYFSKKGQVLERAVTHFPGGLYQAVGKLERIVS